MRACCGWEFAHESEVLIQSTEYRIQRMRFVCWGGSLRGARSGGVLTAGWGQVAGLRFRSCMTC
jgi:hypothetical protein